MTGRIRLLFPAGLIAFALWSCIKINPLAPIDNGGIIGAGDTSYLPLSPTWDNTFGLSSPVEISIANDGHIFVADTATNSILVYDQSGNHLDGFDALANLTISDTLNVKPIDVDIDSKMDVLFIDGSNKVYVWNQVWNTSPITEYVQSADFVESGTGNTVTATLGSQTWYTKANNANWTMTNLQWDNVSEKLDSLMNPHVLYDGSWPVNIAADAFLHDSPSSQFTAISATDGTDNFFFVADKHIDRLLQIKLQHSMYVRNSNGDEFWTHRGVFGATIAQYGTGSGTVNRPVGLDVDYSGAVYYSQLGDYFSVHKIQPITSGGYTVYSSVFQPDVNDIMDLGRFQHAQDVAVDQNKMIYVADRGAHQIQVFNSKGQFFKYAGPDSVAIDTTMWVLNSDNTAQADSVLVDTVYYQHFSHLEDPSAVTVDAKGVVYVCDTPNHRIVRFQLSNLLDENLVPNQ